MGRWQEVDHTADLALHVWGIDLADLFSSAAAGMFSLVATSDGTGQILTRRIELNAPDAESLLVDWLNELLYLSELSEAVFTSFTFRSLTPQRLEAHIEGRVALGRRTYVKAATFHNLEIVVGALGCETEIVFDI